LSEVARNEGGVLLLREGADWRLAFYSAEEGVEKQVIGAEGERVGGIAVDIDEFPVGGIGPLECSGEVNLEEAFGCGEDGKFGGAEVFCRPRFRRLWRRRRSGWEGGEYRRNG
jgi:hypothetical protein